MDTEFVGTWVQFMTNHTGAADGGLACGIDLGYHTHLDARAALVSYVNNANADLTPKARGKLTCLVIDRGGRCAGPWSGSSAPRQRPKSGWTSTGPWARQA